MSDLNKLKELANLERFISFWKKAAAGQLTPSKNEIEHTVWFLEGLAQLDVNLQQQADQLEAAQQRIAELEESLTLAGHDMDTVRYRSGLLENKITQLEAELVRRNTAAGEPIGEIRLSEYDDNGIRAATVHCLHGQADWENFEHGTKLFIAAQPSALPKKIPDVLANLLYDECGGYVDCNLDASKVWAAFRKYVEGKR